VDRPIQENENRAAPVIRRLAEFPIGTFTLTDEESWAVAIYLAILNRRVPSATATLGRQFEALREYWTIAPLEDPDLFWQGWQERGWPGGRDEAEATRLSFLAQLRDPGTRLTDADLVSLLGVGVAPFIAEQLCHRPGRSCAARSIRGLSSGTPQPTSSLRAPLQEHSLKPTIAPSAAKSPWIPGASSSSQRRTCTRNCRTK
jgi:hypothetical protein